MCMLAHEVLRDGTEPEDSTSQKQPTSARHTFTSFDWKLQANYAANRFVRERTGLLAPERLRELTSTNTV